jgi:LPXTG-motif cell wall-anchored protein
VRGIPAGCVMAAFMTLAATTSASALVIPPVPVPSPSVPMFQPPVPPSLPPLPVPTSVPDVGIPLPADPQPAQVLPTLLPTPGVPDQATRPLTPSDPSTQGPPPTQASPSPKTASTGAGGVCPVLGGGGPGCQSVPAWLSQQLADTGYRGIAALLVGITLTLAGVAGWIVRRRRQALP